MNKKLLVSGLVLTTLATTGALSYASESNTGTTTNLSTKMDTFKGKNLNRSKQNNFNRNGFKHGEQGNKNMFKLTDDEKTKLEAMNSDERKAFFEIKQKENEVKIEARETVMDKLISGEELTTEAEKTIQKEIITERAQMKKMREEFKIKQAEQKKTMDEIKTIINKKKSGTSLTSDEVAKLLDYFSSKITKKDIDNSGNSNPQTEEQNKLQ